MKKLFGFMTCLAVLLAGVMFTGCDEVEDELAGPENTWCELPVYITASEANGDQPDMYLDVIYVPTDYSKQSGSTNLGIDLPAGITVVAHARIKIDSLGMDAGSYVVKTFGLNDSDNTDSTDNDSYTFKGSKAKWTALYWSKKAMHDTSTQNVLPKAPTPVCNTNTGYTELTNLTNFSWKQLLANYLLNSL
ncbi:MAG: hypothetical protein IJJ70_08785 [Treponema sp.]|nr:hypothetical protein [Treponema sp.]MBR0487779.1 hypothetical protein [Treponema sp.]